jgi:5-methylcytosine-specific restriction protein A
MASKRKIGTLKPALKAFDARAVKPAPKTVDPFYLTPQYDDWRAKVIANAGGRCQAIENGIRCWKARPVHRMFADHIVERQDGGALYDLANGQCLCGRHHTLKTLKARAERLGGGGIKSLSVGSRQPPRAQ